MADATGIDNSTLSLTAWQRFWFLSDKYNGPGSYTVMRLGMAVIAIWYFLSHWSDIGLWFGTGGLLETDRLARFLDAGGILDTASWRWSPLYLVDSILILRGYLGVGVLLALATAWYRELRAPVVLLWLWCVWLANRSLLISGPEELALVFGLAYLSIARPTNGSHWSSALAMRLIQVHTSLLICLSGLTMLSAKIWWDGTGSASVAAPTGRRLVDVSQWLTSPWLHESLTHAIVMVAIAGSIAVWFAATRRIACVSLLLWCGILGLLSSQWMYVATLGVLLQSFRTASSRDENL